MKHIHYIEDSSGLIPKGIHCKPRNNKETGFTITFIREGDNHLWWVKLENSKAHAFGFYTAGRWRR
jgi:hypothetical protein